jgi:hypothetical protein
VNVTAGLPCVRIVVTPSDQGNSDRGLAASVAAAVEAVAFDASSWEHVALPHSFMPALL